MDYSRLFKAAHKIAKAGCESIKYSDRLSSALKAVYAFIAKSKKTIEKISISWKRCGWGQDLIDSRFADYEASKFDSACSVTIAKLPNVIAKWKKDNAGAIEFYSKNGVTMC